MQLARPKIRYLAFSKFLGLISLYLSLLVQRLETLI